MLATGAVDLVAVLVNIAVLSNVGRRWGCALSFGLSGLCMLALLIIPRGNFGNCSTNLWNTK